MGRRARSAGHCCRLLALLMTLLLECAGVEGIQCYVCAPVPELSVTCANVEDADLEACGVTHEYCHLSVSQKVAAHGGMVSEVMRGCGPALYVAPADVVVDGQGCQEYRRNATVQVCHCGRDACNEQLLDLGGGQAVGWTSETSAAETTRMATSRPAPVEQGRPDVPRVTSPLATTRPSNRASAIFPGPLVLLLICCCLAREWRRSAVR